VLYTVLTYISVQTGSECLFTGLVYISINRQQVLVYSAGIYQYRRQQTYTNRAGVYQSRKSSKVAPRQRIASPTVLVYNRGIYQQSISAF
jgi:hypothetical protein